MLILKNLLKVIYMELAIETKQLKKYYGDIHAVDVRHSREADCNGRH